MRKFFRYVIYWLLDSFSWQMLDSHFIFTFWFLIYFSTANLRLHREDIRLLVKGTFKFGLQLWQEKSGKLNRQTPLNLYLYPNIIEKIVDCKKKTMNKVKRFSVKTVSLHQMLGLDGINLFQYILITTSKSTVKKGSEAVRIHTSLPNRVQTSGLWTS